MATAVTQPVTTDAAWYLSGPQFLLALAAAVGLLVFWELGKLVARRA
jgi:hypothetical protein